MNDLQYAERVTQDLALPGARLDLQVSSRGEYLGALAFLHDSPLSGSPHISVDGWHSFSIRRPEFVAVDLKWPDDFVDPEERPMSNKRQSRLGVTLILLGVGLFIGGTLLRCFA